MKERVQKLLILFLGLHFVLWTLVGMIRMSLPVDTAEAIVWGGEWTFITNKHPYLSGWVAEIFFTLFGGNGRVAMAILAAFCSTAAIWFVYRLARQFTDRPRAVAAALLLEGCIYYSAYSLKYNCNVLSAALAPLFFWMAWRALKTDAFRHWIATGLVAGALVMTKYSNGALLAGVAVYTLIWRRDVFRRPGVYLAGVLCLGVCVPHLYCLMQSVCGSLDYVGGISARTSSAWDWALSPIRFLIAQGLNTWGPVILFAVAVILKRFSFKAVPPYLVCGLLPILSFPLYGAISGMELKDMWGYAFVSVLPLVVLLGMEARPNFERWLIRLAFLALVIQSPAMAIVAVCHTSREWLDVDALIAELPVKDPALIGGETWLCSNVAVSLERRPRVVFDLAPWQFPWVSADEIKRSGALALTDNPAAFVEIRQRFPELQDVKEIPLTVKAPFGRKKAWSAYVGYLPPESVVP